MIRRARMLISQKLKGWEAIDQGGSQLLQWATFALSAWRWVILTMGSVFELLALKRARIVFVFAVVVVLANWTFAHANDLFEASGFFPVVINGKTVRLEGALVKKANAQGRLPVAIITNGGTTSTAGVDSSVGDYASIARDLARRGWLSVVVLRRGYGQSEGLKPQPVVCSSEAVSEWASTAADDLQATMAFLAQRPDAEMQRVMVIGPQSGGLAVIALSARRLQGLIAAVSIGGGLAAESKCPIADALEALFREFGSKSNIAHLWIHTKSDQTMPRELVERLHATFLDAGGDVKFVEFHSWGDARQNILGNSRPMWMMQLDAFLRHYKLPAWTEAHAIAIASKMKLTEPARTLMVAHLNETYVPRGGEQVMAVSLDELQKNPSGSWAWSSMRKTLDEARAAALGNCKREATRCVVALENLTWVGGPNFE